MVSEFENKETTTDKHDLWSVKKLIVLRYYLYPFLQILRKNGYKKIHYLCALFLKVFGLSVCLCTALARDSVPLRR